MTANNACPYCKRQALTFLQKTGLGSANSLPCNSCGELVSVNPRSKWACVPALIGIAIGGSMPLSILSITIFVGGVVAAFLVYDAVPLEGRDG